VSASAKRSTLQDLPSNIFIVRVYGHLPLWTCVLVRGVGERSSLSTQDWEVKIRADSCNLTLAIDCSWTSCVWSNPVLLTGRVFILIGEVIEVRLDTRRIQFGCPQLLTQSCTICGRRLLRSTCEENDAGICGCTFRACLQMAGQQRKDAEGGYALPRISLLIRMVRSEPKSLGAGMHLPNWLRVKSTARIWKAMVDFSAKGQKG
jgi:hypothetical protein